jgi:activator of HSP90 ATPase
MDCGDNLLTAGLATSRRQWIKGTAIVVGGFAFGATEATATTENGLSQSAEAIHQETIFKASPKRIYEALTDAQQFQKVVLLSGAMNSSDLMKKPAQISREPGGAFSIFGAFIAGRQIELVPNQRIVQAWREISWPLGIYSIAKFDLKEERSGTKLIFDHTGFPTGNGEHLAAGWKSHYWEALEEFLA